MRHHLAVLRSFFSISREASRQSHSKVGEIVGPILGVLVLVLFAACVWRRFRKSHLAMDNAGIISPLVLPQPNIPPSGMVQTEIRSPVSRKNSPPTQIISESLPPPATPSQQGSSTLPGPPDVNQIIKLIAQRIDRRGDSHSESNLPGYNAHSM
ncbi:hypothetical protein B0H17DRAFT_672078 [Mycena rosella]|uniref:Uncharacterized protein n=1 Tax=Mycena rosella TaxID=1033263 RepID=A0AAD7GUL2_MYCRO|nr:hypothetical protein B0H17DRAFT_672078 [Mycena rosella]